MQQQIIESESGALRRSAFRKCKITVGAQLLHIDWEKVAQVQQTFESLNTLVLLLLTSLYYQSADRHSALCDVYGIPVWYKWKTKSSWKSISASAFEQLHFSLSLQHESKFPFCLSRSTFNISKLNTIILQTIQFIILATLAVVALASDAPYYPRQPAYPPKYPASYPAYPAYPKSYDYVSSIKTCYGQKAKC